MFLYSDRIDIYQIKETIVLQSVAEPTKNINAQVGSYVITRGSEVVVQVFDSDSDDDDNFVAVVIKSIFVTSNPYFFEKLTTQKQ